MLVNELSLFFKEQDSYLSPIPVAIIYKYITELEENNFARQDPPAIDTLEDI